MPERLAKQAIAVAEGKVNPLLKENGEPYGFTIVDDTYDGPEDKNKSYEFNPKNKEARLMTFFIQKFGSFGGIYYECIQLFGIYPKKKAEAKFRYSLRWYSKDRFWYKPSDKTR